MRRSTVTALTATLLLALPLQLAGCAPSTSARPAAPAETSTMEDPTPEADRRVLETSGPLSDALSSDPGFGGIWVDDDHTVHVVMTAERLGGAQDIARDAFADGPPTAIQFEVGQHTYEELVARRDEISELLPPLRAQGIGVSQWGPDVELNAVYVMVVDLEEGDEQTIHEVLGDDVVVLEDEAPEGEPFSGRW